VRDDQLSDRVLRRRDEASFDAAQQSDAFLRLCIEEGFDEDRIVLLARRHAPTRERYQYDLDRQVVRRFEQLRTLHPQGPQATSPFLDWTNAFAGVDAAPDWLAPGFIERGESVALIGPAKVGKSLLSLELAASVATGASFLGKDLEPAHVLYLDLENSQRVVVQRLQDMSFTDRELGQLHYASLPQLGSLDSPTDCGKVLQMAKDTSARLVVIDTLQRVLTGDEFSSQPIRDLYRHLILPLRAMGTAVLRIDHTGKDESRGARGSSAKNDDVDQAWQMSQSSESLQLLRTHSRTGSGFSRYRVERRPDPLRHELLHADDGQGKDTGSSSAASSLTVEELVEVLDDLGLARDAGRPHAGELLKSEGISYRTEALAKAVKLRKAKSH
jgi:hypothetical protein